MLVRLDNVAVETGNITYVIDRWDDPGVDYNGEAVRPHTRVHFGIKDYLRVYTPYLDVLDQLKRPHTMLDDWESYARNQ